MIENPELLMSELSLLATGEKNEIRVHMDLTQDLKSMASKLPIEGLQLSPNGGPLSDNRSMTVTLREEANHDK